MKAILIDDEEYALDYLESLLIKSGQVEVLGKFTNPFEAIEKIKSAKPDVVFLDIEMPETNGIEVATKILLRNNGIHIVFVTAFNEYAVEAFEINALDYLLKPVRDVRLTKTLERVGLIKPSEFKNKQSPAKIRCFKRFEITRAHSEDLIIERFRTSKVQELFAFLISNKNNFVSKEKILDTLWPEFKPERAITHLHTSIYQIRKLMSNAEIGGSIIYLKDCYKIELPGIECDVDQFEEFVKNEPLVNARSITGYEKIVTLYRDDYLAENDYPWASLKRTQLRGLFLEALARMGQYYLEAGKFDKAILFFQALLEKDPYSDKACRELMLAYQRVQDRAAPLRIFNDFAKRLKEDMDIEPEEATKKLYELLVNGKK